MNRRLLYPSLFVGMLILLFLPTWQSMVMVWWNVVTYHHGFIIAPAALFLVWLERRRLADLEARFEPLALLPLACFAVIWLLGEAGDAQLLQHIGVIGLLVSGLVVILGRYIARASAFPLLFLFFMVPFGDFLIPYLQDITARFAVMLLRTLDIPVFHNGIMIDLPNGRFEVAEACAGIRFLIANIVVAAVFAHLSYRRWWKWMTFMALAFAIPILANGLRAFGIILIAHLTDNEYAVGVDHLVYGWGFFTVIMLLVLFLGNLFADLPLPVPRSNLDRGREQQTVSMASSGSGTAIAACLFSILVVAPPAYAHFIMRPATEAAAIVEPSPPRIPGWELSDKPSDWRPKIVNADALAIWRYQQNDVQIAMALAYFIVERQGAEAVYYANRMADGERWIRIDLGTERLSIPGLPEAVRRERLQAYDSHRAVFWWYWIGGRFTASDVSAKLMQIRNRLLGNHQPTAIVAVSAPYEEDPREAHTVIERFLADSIDLQDYLADLPH